MSSIALAAKIGEWIGRLIAWGFAALIAHAWFILLTTLRSSKQDSGTGAK